MNRVHSFRLTTIFLLFLFMYIFVISNLYIIQIKDTAFFKNLALQQYQITVTTKPPRAEIYDRSGTQLLAMNKESISAFITPSHIEQKENLQAFLEKYFPTASLRLKQVQHCHFMYIKRRLTDEQIKLIQESNLPDIKLLKEPSRYYPIESVSSIIGFTDIDNNGIAGLELFYNKTLAGQPSTNTLLKDARSGHFYFNHETKIKGQEGQPIVLSIDSTLQFLVHEELKEAVQKFGSKEGSVLILNPETGEIIVMANFPDFNSNDTENLDLTHTKNRIITDTYELGSVIKIFLALAAFEENVVDPEELIDCEGKKETTINGFHFSTWKQHGVIPFSEVIQGSNNIGVAKVALRLDKKLYDHYKRLGFSKKIGIFPGENPGFINPPNQWSRASIITLSFGYEITASLLQLAQAVSIIANDGILIPPTLFKKNGPEPVDNTQRLYSKEAIDKIKIILEKTITEGAAQNAKLSGYTVMGKTGTARLITDGKYDPHRHIFTFVAIVQKGAYKRIVVTFLKETTQKNPYASTVAAPLFEHVAHKMLIHDKIL